MQPNALPSVTIADLIAKKNEQTPDMVHNQTMEMSSQQQLHRLDSIESSMVSAINSLMRYLDGKTTKTEVVNQLKSIGTPDVMYVVRAIEQLSRETLGNKLDITPLKDGLSAIEKQLKLIPKSETEQKSIEVSNLPDIAKEFGVAVNKIKLEAPKVTVNVDKTDLNPIQLLFKDLLVAVKAIKLPEIKPTDVKGVETRLDVLTNWSEAQDTKLKESNKLLKAIANRPMGGSGGSGTKGVYSNTAGDLVYPVLTAGGAIPVSGTVTVDTSLLATKANQLFGLLPIVYDYMSYTNTNATTDTYVYKSGGSGGTLVATVTIVYTDSTKAQVSTVTRT